MRILLMTDMEGVSGIRDFENWCVPDGRWYEAGSRLLTGEVNAAVEGFFTGGATYVQVADGHGHGGINIELLDPRVEYARGWPEGFPFGLDSSFDGIAHVGQHAKASTEYAHLCHTQSFSLIDMSVNEVSIGEFGQMAMCAAELNVPAFFAAGDLAFTKEAAALVPGITTCAIKRGVRAGRGEDDTVDEYQRRNSAAIHTPPERARAMIRDAAEQAMRDLRERRTGEPKPTSPQRSAPPPFQGGFGAGPPLLAPFELKVVFRPVDKGQGKTVAQVTHPTSVIELMRMSLNPQPS